MYFNGLWYTYKTRVTQRSTEPCVTAALSTFTQSVVRADGLQNKEYQWKTLQIASKNIYKKYIHLKHHIMLEADSIIYVMAAMSMMTKKYIKNKCSSFRSAWVYIGGTYPILIHASVFRPLTVTNSPRILRSAHTFPARTVPVSGPLN